MYKKLVIKGLVLFLALFIVQFADARDLIISPNIVDQTYSLGSSQPQPIMLNFTNRDNSTFSLSLSKSGSSTDFVTLSQVSLSFSGQESKTVQINFNIPSSTPAGLYTGNIIYDSGINDKIPVYVNVIQNTTTGCKFIIPFTEYEYSVKIGTTPNTQSFLVKVSSECPQGLLLTELRTTGVILTDAGFAPIRLTGGSPVNQQIPSGGTFTFTLETDVNELSTGAYTSFVVLSGIAGNNIVTANIKYKTTVTGVAGPVSGVITPPTFEKLPDDLSLNQTYDFIVKNVNPNLNIFVEPNEYIYGIDVLVQQDTWKYTFRPQKSGNTIFRSYASYNGGIIGSVFTQELRILVSGPAIGGTNLTLETYPNSTLWTSGTKVSVLAKDTKSGNIVSNPFIYVNGILITGNSFDIGSNSEYKLSITAPGYNTIEQIFKVNPQPIQISLTPGSNVDLNTNVTVTTTPEDAVININGISSLKSFITDREGTFVIVATKEGYLSSNVTLLVQSLPPSLMTTTTTVKKGTNVTLELSKEGTWTAYYKKTLISPREPITTQTSKLVNFPVRFNQGVYSVEINGQEVWAQQIESTSIFQKIPVWAWVGAGVILIALLFVLVFSSNKNKSYSTEDDTPKFEFEQGM